MAACVIALGTLLASADSDALQAGAAKAVIELPTEHPLAGHAYRRGRDAQQQEGTFYARSLYLEDDNFHAVLVSLDLYAITTELRARIIANLPDGLTKENVILTATHTHSGPGGLAEPWFYRQIYGRYMGDTLDRIVTATHDSMRSAMESRTRATIGYEIGESKSLTRNAYSERGIQDTDLGVVRVDDSDGNPIAILGVFSGAPATFRRDRGLVMSPDFPGVFCEELESMSADGMVAFFLSSASGDQICKKVEGKKGSEWTHHIGSELALQVKAVANTIKCEEFQVGIHAHTQKVPHDSRRTFLPDEVIFQGLTISRLMITFVPGEPTAALKTRLSREVRRGQFRSHILVGLSNDNLLDLAPPVESDNPPIGPENTVNLLGDHALDWCLEAVTALTDVATNPSDAAHE